MKLFPFLPFLLISIGVSAQNYYINEDFNNSTLPASWIDTTISGNFGWSFGIDASVTDPGNNNIDGTPLAYFDDDSYGSSNLNNTVQLYTPTFNNSNDSASWLEFDYNFRAVNAINDYFKVEIFDGTNWQTLLNQTTDNCGRWNVGACLTGFPHAKINISSYKNSNCQVRFSYHDGNDWGWYLGLDNVQVYSLYNNDLSISNIISPISVCDNDDTLSVRIHNNGANTVNGFNIAYQLASGALVSNTSNDSILPGDSLNFRFNNALNRSSFSSNQNITIFLINSDDDLSNDTLISVIEAISPPFIPYVEDFESNAQTWSTSGTNSSWARGIPDSSLTHIFYAPSGNQAFVTNLTGDHNNNEYSYITSNCFSFNNSNGILLSFFLNYQTEAGFDQCWMEYSLDNGASWQKVNQGTFSKNWYNNSTDSVWEGNSNGWIKVLNSLDGFQNYSSVQFRFVFKSDHTTVGEGIGLDRISFTEKIGTDASLERIVYPANIYANNECNSLPNPMFLEVEILNSGANTLNDFIISFLDQGSTIISDTVQNFNLPSYQSKKYAFTKAFDSITNQFYSTNIWMDVNNDLNPYNDSITNYIIDLSNSNQSIQLPYAENFNNFPVPGLSSGWTASSGNTVVPRWESNSGATGSNGTGPLGDHAGNGVVGNGTYLYTEASGAQTAQSAALISPCIELNKLSYYNLEFDYHKHGGDMGDLYLDVYDGTQWINGVDLIQGETHPNQADPWYTRVVSLKSFKNKVIKLRFRGTYGGGFAGDMAIDNIILSDTLYTNVSLDSILSPQSGCNLSSTEPITIRLTNTGFQDLLPNSTSFSYSLDGQSFISETLIDTIPVDSSYDFTFNQTADLSTNDTLYNLRLSIFNQNDIISNDDTLEVSISNYSATLPYVEDFEDSMFNICQTRLNTLADLPRAWTTKTNPTSNKRPIWLVQNDSICNFSLTQGATETTNTGPSSAHSGNKFLYFEATRMSFNSNFSVTSSCVKLPNQNNLVLSFYYHMFGSAISRLNIDILDNSGRISKVDSIIGQVQTSNTDPWLKRTIQLDSFKNRFINVRFTVSYDSTPIPSIFNGDIAIDSIAIYNSLTVSNNELTAVKKITLFPNPSRGQYFIQSTEDLNGVEYQIYNLQSKLIQSGKLSTGKNQINLSDQSKGIYLLEIEEYGIRQKLIKY